MSQNWFYGNRLTPEPELDGRRTGVVRNDDRVRPSVLKGWTREIKKDIFYAMEHRSESGINSFLYSLLSHPTLITAFSVVIPDNYSLSEHQARIDIKPPTRSEPGWRQGELIIVEGDHPSVLVDFQGVVAAWIFPRFMKRNTLVGTSPS